MAGNIPGPAWGFGKTVPGGQNFRTVEIPLLLSGGNILKIFQLHRLYVFGIMGKNLEPVYGLTADKAAVELRIPGRVYSGKKSDVGKLGQIAVKLPDSLLVPGRSRQSLQHLFIQLQRADFKTERPKGTAGFRNGKKSLQKPRFLKLVQSGAQKINMVFHGVLKGIDVGIPGSLRFFQKSGQTFPVKQRADFVIGFLIAPVIQLFVVEITFKRIGQPGRVSAGKEQRNADNPGQILIFNGLDVQNIGQVVNIYSVAVLVGTLKTQNKTLQILVIRKTPGFKPASDISFFHPQRFIGCLNS